MARHAPWTNPDGNSRRANFLVKKHAGKAIAYEISMEDIAEQAKCSTDLNVLMGVSRHVSFYYLFFNKFAVHCQINISKYF